MIDSIKTVSKNSESKIEMKKSVFIGTIINVTDEEDAKRKLDELRSKYKDATHNVPAYRIYDASKNMIIEKCSDDGEPQGTSGKPILDLLKHKDMLNTLVVVTRYFGGTLLGTGGLVKAYTDCAKELIENANIVTLKLKDYYKL
ncbi:MAG: YigZ family protein, partial [Clostridia bacterium]|nr:YigZ family protein [Clostridia bacterium]